MTKFWQWCEAIDVHRLRGLVARDHLGLDHKQPGEVKAHNALFSKFLRGAMEKQADKYRTRWMLLIQLVLSPFSKGL